MKWLLRSVLVLGILFVAAGIYQLMQAPPVQRSPADSVSPALPAMPPAPVVPAVSPPPAPPVEVIDKKPAHPASKSAHKKSTAKKPPAKAPVISKNKVIGLPGVPPKRDFSAKSTTE